MKTKLHIKSISSNNKITQFCKGYESKKYEEYKPGQLRIYDQISSRHREILLEQRIIHSDDYTEIVLETTYTHITDF